MKMNSCLVRCAALGASVCFVLAWTGCETTSSSEKESSSKAAAGTEGVHFRKVDKIEKVWVTEGFDFAGYDTLLVVDTESSIKPRDEKESDQLQLALRYMQRGFVDAFQIKNFIANVVAKESDVKPGAKVLKLHTTVLEFDRGSTTTQIFAGIYGAGRARFVIRGVISDPANGKQFVVFEDKSKGSMWSSELSGSSEAVQKLALDWGGFLVRLAKHEPIDWDD